MKRESEKLRIRVRLTPKGRRNSILGWARDGEDAPYLRVSVTAVPEDDKANRAMISLLADEWGIAKNRIAILRGRTDRNKLLEINVLDFNPSDIHDTYRRILS